MADFEIIDLPEDALPAMEELSGDLRLVAEEVGVRQAIRLAQKFNGTMIRLYNVNKWLRRHRDRCIRRDYDAGATGIELARKYGLSDRRIWDILAATEPPPSGKQLKLWG
ncbi:MAG: Mor transcription activator family protein [Thermodesulfobacteriota bacterium]